MLILTELGSIEWGPIIIIALALGFLIISELGFSFYLWYLSCNPDHDQRRLLNILYGYLSLVCLGAGLAMMTVIILLTLPQEYRTYVGQINVRVGLTLFSALYVTFLLISFASLLSHFKPNLYLELSLRWRNKIAMPILLLIAISIENMMRLPCVRSDDASQCEASKMRVRVTIPATIVSFLCQLVVVVDDLWGWRKLLTLLRDFCTKCKPGTVAPAPDNEPELANPINA